jgi:heat shock protein HslJ
MLPRMRPRWIILLPLVVLTLAACGDDEGSDSTPLEGTPWMLVTADGMDAVPDVPAPLTLADGQASGSTGCNSFSGSYTLEGDQLSFGPLGATQMACEEPLMTQEAEVFAILGAAESYSIEGDELTISSPGGSLVYRAEA